ncbi:winged helix-turn-helix domain-containing protein [Streptomyces sp. NPDC049881]|uniref:winged helix-turn-helix domain-containing protein n=1 Tax=Streptomyces sp. NPDC049881 TaxID=3155778 RepID=UPI00341D984F
MVYRIHFTVEDLARTRLAPPSASQELVAAVRLLHRSNRLPRLAAWRRSALTDLGPSASMVFDLIPPTGGCAPAFLTSEETDGPPESLERIRTASASQLDADLAHLAERRRLPTWTQNLGSSTHLRQQLAESLDHASAVLLAPQWTRITGTAAVDRGLRTQQALIGGMEHLLSSLNPRRIRWDPPVLAVSLLSGLDDDLHLGGRGLLLIPSAFGAGGFAIDDDARPQPILRYPMSDNSGPPLSETATEARSALASLLGPTRAAVLHTIAGHPGCSTKELAALTGIASSTASEHATSLRTAGLIRTVRSRNSVLHSTTPLGVAVLNAPSGTADR